VRILAQSHIFPGDACALRIGMGGEWALARRWPMESVPPRWRGILSGILQSGYSVGYLLAAVVARFVLPTWGWRPMFWLGGLPALLAFYISARGARIGSLEANIARRRRVRLLKIVRRSVEKLPLSLFC